MKKSLLELTQSILTSLDGEEINSITDTVESRQVVNFIRNSYEEIIAGADLPQQKTLFELTPSGNNTQPTLMYLPETAQNLYWLKYDKSDTDNPYLGYQDITYMCLEDFLPWMYGNNLEQDNTGSFVLSIPTGTFTFYYQNDKAPDYYTTIADNILIFDSFDVNTEVTLQGTKTSCFGEIVETFTEDDSFVLNLTPKEFALLENEAKAQAFVEQKQTSNPTAEKRARKGWIRTQHQKTSIPYSLNSRLNTSVNYGKTNYGYVRRNLRNGW